MRKIALFFLTAFSVVVVVAQENPLWMRYPAISPDGKNIVFSYKGDLYKVAAAGGDAYPLTLHEAHDICRYGAAMESP